MKKLRENDIKWSILWSNFRRAPGHMDEDTENSPGQPTAGPRRSAQREAELRACEPFIQGMLKNYAECGCPSATSGAQILILTDSDWFCDLDSLGAPKYQVYSSIIKYHSLSRFWQLDALELHRIPSNSLLGFLLVLGRSDTCIDLLGWSWHLKTLEFNRV